MRSMKKWSIRVNHGTFMIDDDPNLFLKTEYQRFKEQVVGYQWVKPTDKTKLFAIWYGILPSHKMYGYLLD